MILAVVPSSDERDGGRVRASDDGLPARLAKDAMPVAPFFTAIETPSARYGPAKFTTRARWTVIVYVSSTTFTVWFSSSASRVVVSATRP